MIALFAFAGFAIGWVIHSVRTDRWHARHGVTVRLHDDDEQVRGDTQSHNGSF